MDRLSRAEVGGPYASHDDAMRAIQNKGFDADPADLTVQEGPSDKDEDDTSKESSLKQAKFPPPADSGGGATMKPSPEDPLKDDVKNVKPEPAAPAPAENTAPDDTADPTAPDDGSSLPGLPEAAGAPVDPLGDPETQVTTTKPAQVPSGGGGGMPGEEGEVPGMPEEDGDIPGSEEDVSKPPEATAQTTKPEDGSGTDPIGNAVDSVTDQVRQDNPGLPETLARKIARKVVGKMLQANALMPHIEDPLVDKKPHELIKPILQTLPKGSPSRAPSHQDERYGDPAAPIGNHPDDDDDGGDEDSSSLPGPMAPGFQRGGDGRLLAATPGAGAEAAGAGAAAEGTGLASGAAELAPLLLL